jgi:uncharacterized protein (DUF302 family)
MKRLTTLLVLVLLAASANGLLAEEKNVSPQELLMVRVENNFPEAMNALQQAIVGSGYTLMRVQRVDIGLTKSGYKTAEYRIVFFGKKDEIQALAKNYPQLIPFLPLKLVIFAEGDETIVMGANPAKLASFYPEKKLKPYFTKWEKDFREILRRIRS